MIDLKKASISLGAMTILDYFPSADDARAAILGEVCEMAADNEQVEWLARRVRKLWTKWEGIHELRAVFCSRHKPADGIEAFSSLPQFADGIPSEKPGLPALASAETKQLATGEPVTASPSIAGTVADLVRAKDLNRKLRQLPAPVREIPVVKLTDANRITAADVKTAELAVRAQKAREAVGG